MDRKKAKKDKRYLPRHKLISYLLDSGKMRKETSASELFDKLAEYRGKKIDELSFADIAFFHEGKDSLFD